MVYFPLFWWRPELGIAGSYTMIWVLFLPRSGFVQPENEPDNTGDFHVKTDNGNVKFQRKIKLDMGGGGFSPWGL